MINVTSRKLLGHVWTIVPTLRHRVLPRRAPKASRWSTTIEEPGVGRVEIEGRYRREEEADVLVVVLHGLGGHADSAYVVDAAIAVGEAGHSCLRLCLRGAGQSGQDLYHAGLTADLRAALDDPAFGGYEHIFVIGYSLGGHVALRTAVEGADPRLRAVAAICSPLDLRAVQKWLDAPARYIYREYLLRELRALYAEVARRGRAPTPVERVRKVRTLLEWDALTVVPRFGFSDPDDYYESMSVGPRIDDLGVPSLLVASHHDPMVPADTIAPLVEGRSQHLEICWVDRGGHVFFPPGVDLGIGSSNALVPQVIGWLESHT